MKILYYDRNDDFLVDEYGLGRLLFYYYEYKKAIRMNLYADKRDTLIRRHYLIGQLILQATRNPPPYDDVQCL